MKDGVRPGTMAYPFPEPPDHGEAVAVADGILWLRLPLPMALDHVNVYALDDGDSWTLIDTGVHSRRSLALMEMILSGPLRCKPVGRVLMTHHHPDHVGLVGWFAGRGAEVWASRTAWLYARMLTLDEQPVPTPQAMDFYRSAGVDREKLAKRSRERPFNFADLVHPIPPGFRRLRQGDEVRIGGRDWTVQVGHGHAPEHVTLWSGDLVIGGDQILPTISPNIGVHPNEPEADPLAEWLASCARLGGLAREDHLVLCGHKLPFTGLPLRLRHLIENHQGCLRRLKEHLQEPRTAADCFAPLFKRSIGEGEFGLALAEAVAHLNHLLALGEVTRERSPDGAWLWRVV